MAEKQIICSLTQLLVSDVAASQRYYRDVLGCEVTDWWVSREGLTGLAIKLIEAAAPADVRPNPPGRNHRAGRDIYCYVENWEALDSLYAEFKANGATIDTEPWINEKDGPWKEFAVRDPDGYCLAFGGINPRADAR